MVAHIYNPTQKDHKFYASLENLRHYLKKGEWGLISVVECLRSRREGLGSTPSAGKKEKGKKKKKKSLG